MTDFKAHITSNNALSLKDLRQVLEIIDLGINDIKREQGITNNALNRGDNATIITNVERGSIILQFALGVAINVTSALIVNSIQKRIAHQKNKKIDIHTQVKDNVMIDIHIEN